MTIQLLAVLAMQTAAMSPERAALRVVHSTSKTAPVVRRVNVFGRYATVLTRGGFMEGSPVDEAILVEHFSFGWQALEILNARCRLRDHALDARTERTLMQGMPIPRESDPRMCEGLRDAGPVSDIEEVRSRMHEPLVPYVVVSNSWAIGAWYGAGGGNSLWKKRAGVWRFIQGGGGALGVAEMRKYGVPKSDWCTFGIAGATCR